MARRVRAYIGLGANVGDARRTLSDAVAALAALPGARLRGVSRLYRTKPVGVTDQADFLNAVAALDVPAGPDPATGATDLLLALKRLERDAGRRQRRRWGPRELDLDLLVFGRHRLAVERPLGAERRSAAADSGTAAQRSAEADPVAAVDPGAADLDPVAAARLLEVPHPSMLERLFVLAPLADLAPGLVLPGSRHTVETSRRIRLRQEGDDAAEAVGEWTGDAWRTKR